MRRLVLFVVSILAASLLVVAPPASADTPHAVYSCFLTDTGNVLRVYRLSQCKYGIITIYSTYDTKTHGKIYVENGRAYKPITWAQFCKVVLHLSEAAASKVFWRKVWACAKKFYNESKNPPDDPVLPVEPVP